MKEIDYSVLEERKFPVMLIDKVKQLNELYQFELISSDKDAIKFMITNNVDDSFDSLFTLDFNKSKFIIESRSGSGRNEFTNIEITNTSFRNVFVKSSFSFKSTSRKSFLGVLEQIHYDLHTETQELSLLLKRKNVIKPIEFVNNMISVNLTNIVLLWVSLNIDSKRVIEIFNRLKLVIFFSWEKRYLDIKVDKFKDFYSSIVNILSDDRIHLIKEILFNPELNDLNEYVISDRTLFEIRNRTVLEMLKHIKDTSVYNDINIGFNTRYNSTDNNLMSNNNEFFLKTEIKLNNSILKFNSTEKYNELFKSIKCFFKENSLDPDSINLDFDTSRAIIELGKQTGRFVKAFFDFDKSKSFENFSIYAKADLRNIASEEGDFRDGEAPYFSDRIFYIFFNYINGESHGSDYVIDRKCIIYKYIESLKKITSMIEDGKLYDNFLKSLFTNYTQSYNLNSLFEEVISKCAYMLTIDPEVVENYLLAIGNSAVDHTLNIINNYTGADMFVHYKPLTYISDAPRLSMYPILYSELNDEYTLNYFNEEGRSYLLFTSLKNLIDGYKDLYDISDKNLKNLTLLRNTNHPIRITSDVYAMKSLYSVKNVSGGSIDDIAISVFLKSLDSSSRKEFLLKNLGSNKVTSSIHNIDYKIYNGKYMNIKNISFKLDFEFPFKGNNSIIVDLNTISPIIYFDVVEIFNLRKIKFNNTNSVEDE